VRLALVQEAVKHHLELVDLIAQKHLIQAWENQQTTVERHIVRLDSSDRQDLVEVVEDPPLRVEQLEVRLEADMVEVAKLLVQVVTVDPVHTVVDKAIVDRLDHHHTVDKVDRDPLDHQIVDKAV